MTLRITQDVNVSKQNKKKWWWSYSNSKTLLNMFKSFWLSLKMYSKLAYIAKVPWKTLIVHYDWTEEETEDFFHKSLQSQRQNNQWKHLQIAIVLHWVWKSHGNAAGDMKEANNSLNAAVIQFAGHASKWQSSSKPFLHLARSAAAAAI